MTNPFPGPMDALANLLEERARYEAWLEQLGARAGNVSEHVLERVRGDYQDRLRGVIDQLRSRAVELETNANGMKERIAALLVEETERRDERTEAELRAAVGEFSPEYARDLLTRCDEAIGRLFGERGALSGELAKIQEILTLVRRPVPLSAPEPVPPLTSPSTPEPVAPPDAASFDELAFLQSVVQPRPRPAPAAAPSAPQDFTSVPVAPMRHAAPGMRGEGDPQAAAASRTVAATPENMPAFLKDVPTEQAKTLKCQECGTMNYATEWYCERCGGELAAM